MFQLAMNSLLKYEDEHVLGRWRPLGWTEVSQGKSAENEAGEPNI